MLRYPLFQRIPVIHSLVDGTIHVNGPNLDPARMFWSGGRSRRGFIVVKFT